MDGQNYLNQISASVRPTKKPRHGLLGSPIFKVIFIGIIAFIIIIIVGSIFSSGRASVESQTVSLKLHLDNTLEVISTYQPSVKSSDLRSSSASLYSVLLNTSRELTAYLTDTYNYKDNSSSYQTESDNANLNRDALDSSLMNAKINGILDQIYMSKLSYEISVIMSEESTIYSAAKNETLKSLLSNSYSSLETLLPYFSDSSTK